MVLSKNSPNSNLFRKLLIATSSSALLFAGAVSFAGGTADDTRTSTGTLPSQTTNGGSAADDANKSSGLQSLTSVISSLVGAGLISEGTPLLSNPETASQGAMLVGMGLQSLAQAASLANTAGGAKNASGAMAFDIPNYDYNSPSIDTKCPGCDPKSAAAVGGLSAAQIAAINKAKSDMAAAGFTVKDGQLVGKGKSYPLDGFGSAAGMKAMGFNDADISRAMGLAKDKGAKIASKFNFGNQQGSPAAAGGGGGAKRGAASMDGSMGIDYDKIMGRHRQIDKEKIEPSVAGMSKKFGGENIGVSGDNIFQMVNRRYKSQDERNGFLREQ
jgi:hypothetical protein